MSNKLVLFGLLLPFLGGAGWLVCSRIEAPPESPSTAMDSAFGRKQADDDVLFEIYLSLIDRIRFDPRRTNLTEDRSIQLMLAIQFFEGVAERSVADLQSSHRLRRIVAYQQMGLAHLLLRDNLAAESAFHESQRICRTQLEYQEDPGIRALSALNEEALGWTQAMLGRFDEAASLTRAAASHWEELAAKRPAEISFFTNLAVCQRNLAIISEHQGKSGLAEARAAAQTAAVFLQRQEPSPFRYDLLLDCEEVLSGFLFKRGHIAEAEQICRAKIEHIQVVLNEIDSLAESTDTIPTDEPYRDALVRSRRNLALVDRASPDNRTEVDAHLVSMSPQESWNWNVVRPIVGQTLGEEFLVSRNSMPGEFEPHDALLVNWQEPWAHGPLLQILSAVTAKLRVMLLVRDRRQQHAAEQRLIESGISLDRVEFLQQLRQYPLDSRLWTTLGPLNSRQRRLGGPKLHGRVRRRETSIRRRRTPAICGEDPADPDDHIANHHRGRRRIEQRDRPLPGLDQTGRSQSGHRYRAGSTHRSSAVASGGGANCLSRSARRRTEQAPGLVLHIHIPWDDRHRGVRRRRPDKPCLARPPCAPTLSIRDPRWATERRPHPDASSR